MFFNKFFNKSHGFLDVFQRSSITDTYKAFTALAESVAGNNGDVLFEQ